MFRIKNITRMVLIAPALNAVIFGIANALIARTEESILVFFWCLLCALVWLCFCVVGLAIYTLRMGKKNGK